jgi:alkanesulfonate monooxygenase
MSIEFIWQLPTAGDGRYADAKQYRRGERLPGDRPPFTDGVTDPRGKKFNYFDYLHQIARAADLSGFNGIQIQHDLNGDESWIVAGYVARSTRHLKLLTEFEASRGSSVYAAKNAVSYQRYTGGRFAWQISTSGSEAERRQQADFVADSDQLARIDEFLTVARGVLTQQVYSFKGEFFEVLEGGFKGPLANQPVPQVYLSGNSEEAFQLSAKQADVHLLDAAPVEEMQVQISRLQKLAAEQQRTLKIGLRIDVLARESTDEALFDAQRFLSQSDRSEAINVDLSTAVLWKDFATERTGAKATLIGSYEQIIEQLIAYTDIGISSFVLAGIPHFEEAYRIGEHVLPKLRARLSDSHSPNSPGTNSHTRAA